MGARYGALPDSVKRLGANDFKNSVIRSKRAEEDNQRALLLGPTFQVWLENQAQIKKSFSEFARKVGVLSNGKGSEAVSPEKRREINRAKAEAALKRAAVIAEADRRGR